MNRPWRGFPEPTFSAKIRKLFPAICLFYVPVTELPFKFPSTFAHMYFCSPCTHGKYIFVYFIARVVFWIISYLGNNLMMHAVVLKRQMCGPAARISDQITVTSQAYGGIPQWYEHKILDESNYDSFVTSTYFRELFTSRHSLVWVQWEHYHPPLRKMTAISWTIFSGAFSWMKSFVFWITFHWSLFPRDNSSALVHVIAWCRIGHRRVITSHIW